VTSSAHSASSLLATCYSWALMLWGNTIEEFIKIMFGTTEERSQAKQIETKKVWLPTQKDEEPPF